MQRNRLVPYTFLLPYLAIFLLFWAWPILYSFYLSFLDTRGFPWALEPGVNWGRILSDPFFRQAFWNTVILLAVQVPVMLLLATGLAVGLNSAPAKTKRLLPLRLFRARRRRVGGVFSGFQTFIQHAKRGGQCGSVRPGLTRCRLAQFAFTGLYPDRPDRHLALDGLQRHYHFWRGCKTSPWSFTKLPKSTAQIPGSSFGGITLPLLRPIMLFALVLSVIGTLQLFTEPFLITGGGPGNATLTLGVYLYQQGFRSFNFGYASSIGYAIALLAVIFSALQLRLFGQDPS